MYRDIVGNARREAQRYEIQNRNREFETIKRLLYGRQEGHWKWDLAVHWFQMTNDGFHRLYGFNIVPRGRLFDEAKDFVHYGR